MKDPMVESMELMEELFPGCYDRPQKTERNLAKTFVAGAGTGLLALTGTLAVIAKN